jgi:hypothetical protein
LVIQGLDFSGFPGGDANNLRHLDYPGRVAWFKFRFELVFATPFQRLLTLEDPDCYIWICAMSLIGSAVTSLADFAGRGSDPDKFARFVNRYLPTFSQSAFHLHDPLGTPNSQAVSPAEQLYRYFRNGLAHNFCIQWGGLQHREQVGALGFGYLFETVQGTNGETGLGIVPREFAADFQAGCTRFITELETAPLGSDTQRSFDRTFERVYLRKQLPPLPLDRP